MASADVDGYHPLWDRVGHAAVFYYGAVFAIVGMIGLLVAIPGRHNNYAEVAIQ